MTHLSPEGVLPESGDAAFRVRQMLALIRSVLRRSARDIADVPTYAARLEGRIASIARVQFEAINDPKHGIALDALIQDELQTHAVRQDGAATIETAGFKLNMRAAGAFSLAIHELIVNSIEAGALSVSDCYIAVTARVEDEIFRFMWREALPPRHDRAAFESFSKEYLEDGISYDLGAVTRLEIGREALSFSLEAPVAGILLIPPIVATLSHRPDQTA